jgi:hypothetical protein
MSYASAIGTPFVSFVTYCKKSLRLSSVAIENVVKSSEGIVLNALRRCGEDPLSLASFAPVLGWLHEDDSLFR